MIIELGEEIVKNRINALLDQIQWDISKDPPPAYFRDPLAIAELAQALWEMMREPR